jgi:hypothetical protein
MTLRPGSLARIATDSLHPNRPTHEKVNAPHGAGALAHALAPARQHEAKRRETEQIRVCHLSKHQWQEQHSNGGATAQQHVNWGQGNTRGDNTQRSMLIATSSKLFASSLSVPKSNNAPPLLGLASSVVIKCVFSNTSGKRALPT